MFDSQTSAELCLHDLNDQLGKGMVTEISF
jgi:hypothetical protein